MNAKKLPSGNYRARVLVSKDKDGKQHFKSFTAPTKKEAELMALNYSGKCTDTVSDCVEKYINMQTPVLDASTIHGYKDMSKRMFPSIMSMSLDKVDNLILKQAVSDEIETIQPNGKKLSAKTIRNRYGLLSAAIRTFEPSINTRVKLPRVKRQIPDLPTFDVIYAAFKGTDIELPVMLAMWLSFTMSEILGLKKSSIYGDYIQIDQVRMRMGSETIEKELAKVDTRTRRHRIPEYIKTLLDDIPEEQEYIVDMTSAHIYGKFKRILKNNNIEHITFHKLRYINASSMALLEIPDKYAQERGGWKTDHTMKSVYMHTFSNARKEVDDKIDNYFNSLIGAKDKGIPDYYEFLKLFKLDDTDKSVELYNNISKMIDMKVDTLPQK